MIVQLTGTLLELRSSYVVLDVGGVAFGLGVSAQTVAELPPVGSSDVVLLTRLVVREDAMELFGFATREERTLFDKLVAISGVGPKLALAALSTFSPQGLASVVVAQDLQQMAQIPGVGKRKAQRLLVELQDVFEKDEELRLLAHQPSMSSSPETSGLQARSIDTEVEAALLAMGFTEQEAHLALEGREEAGASTTEAAVAYALRRLGGGL